MDRATRARDRERNAHARKQSSKSAGAAPAIAVVYRPIEALKLDPANARKHSRKQIRRIAQSIKVFGFNVPVLIDAGLNVIAGHGRLLACRELGWDEVPTISLSHLDDAQARAYAIADNRLSENSRWDHRLLAEQLRNLSLLKLDFDLDITGFDIGEINLRIAGLETESGFAGLPSGDKKPMAAKGSRVARKGDTWILGEHRIYCGTALAPEIDRALISTERAAIIFADPICADALIKRWQVLTGGKARHAKTGLWFGDPAEASDAS